MSALDEKIFVLISGHATLFIHERANGLKYCQRRLFPGDSCGDGPLSFDFKPG